VRARATITNMATLFTMLIRVLGLRQVLVLWKILMRLLRVFR
jgi:hypothetical protein